MRDKYSTIETTPHKGKDTSWLRVLVAIGYPLPVAAVLFCIFCSFYLGTEIVIFLILSILTVLGYLGVVISILRPSPKVDEPSPIPVAPSERSRATSDESSAIAAGILGGILLNRTLKKNTRSSSRKENDFLWQEKVRKDMDDDGFRDW